MATPVARRRVHVRRGDMVEVVGGRYRGKRGKVLKVFPDVGRIIVEGVNVVKRHAKPSPKHPQGGILEKEAPIPSSKVMLVCPRCGEAVRFGHTVTAEGVKVRVCRRCGEQIG
ncbi:MAG: 50S ribosomal protein L24 [Armatimonadota bacterium]|nr:50S ribosomal protein L24 [Armatimonadota bacterium]MDR7449491.1 50S ribosomal protein L24 [Armatimonadota bacterium]MDR7459978.1 50S ribosomal protein L24 [Armatimonadota bacterium]MDR7480689.1 50S ribosomal protein L24 [Armatimonadota bacterium]MDR7489689.1 50S ribosomal protein L24 [Armatimonadota bacterium]